MIVLHIAKAWMINETLKPSVISYEIIYKVSV